MLTLTRRLIALRRDRPALVHGDFDVRPDARRDVRLRAGRAVRARLAVVLNLTDQARTIHDAGPGRVVIGTDRARDGARVDADVELRPNEALVVERG